MGLDARNKCHWFTKKYCLKRSDTKTGVTMNINADNGNTVVAKNRITQKSSQKSV